MPNKYLEQQKTLNDVRIKLSTLKKCLVIRPTGFGKTYLLADLISDPAYKSVLYVYPSAVVKDAFESRCADNYNDIEIDFDPETSDTIEKVKAIDKCDLITYAKFCRLAPDHLASLKYDLVIFDEAHRLGGTKTKKAARILFRSRPNTRFIGATATPDRMDGFDIISQFFGDITTYPFTINDAINANILQAPEYIYVTYDHESNIRDAIIRKNFDPNDNEIAQAISAETKQTAELFNMPGIIRGACEKYARNRDYMKFIVFFANINHMDQKLPEVISWFKSAFKSKNNKNGYDINVLKISSKNSKETKNTSKLKDLVPVTNTIDLICCVDMLNMGYHVKDLTGIMMYRGTSSSTIFIQQLGRALSAGSKNAPIVFDVVDNLHRKPVYDLKHRPGRTKSALAETGMMLGLDGETIVIETDDGQIPVGYKLSIEGEIVDSEGYVCDDLILDAGTGIIYQKVGERIRNNHITKDCILFATGNMPDYDEIAARIIDYPIIRRCREALYMHFKCYFDDNNMMCPINWQNIASTMALPDKDFENWVKSLLIPAGYPADDPDKIIAYGSDRGIDFLDAIAKYKNVTPKQILFTLGYA